MSLPSVWQSGQTHVAFRHSAGLLSVLVSVLLLTSSVLAQTYTYETIDLPFAPFGVVDITGITDLGKLAGTFAVSDIGPFGSWTWTPDAGFRKVTFKDKLLHLSDLAASATAVGLVGTYHAMQQGSPTDAPANAFLITSARLTTLVLPPLVQVETCAVNRGFDIVCTGENAQGLAQAVRVKGATPGVLETYPAGVALLGLNAARDVVGTQFDPQTQTFRGYFREGGTGRTVLLDAPCGLDTVLVDVNDARTLAAAQCGTWGGVGFDGHPRSYAFNGLVWTELTVPGSPATVVRRLNNAGQLVGMFIDPDPEQDLVVHGFLATPQVGQPLAQR